MDAPNPWDLPGPEPAPRRANVAGGSREALRALLARLGAAPYRADQVFEGLYRHRWADWEAFTMLGKDLRARLAEAADLAWPEVIESQASEDGATKHALRLRDGRAVETVHIPYPDRTTLCLSSQVGCALGCRFCATGAMGLVRNLDAAEIVGQVVALLRHHGHPAGRPVNLVFMGMGEPLHNLDHVLGAFAILTDARGLAIPPRRITLSTSGLVPGIARLGTFPRRPRLAVSLNATTDEARSRLMPVNRAWGLDALARALAAFPCEPGERITVEYVLLKDVNDGPEDLRRLLAFCRRFPSKANLIPFNAHDGSGFEPPDEARLQALLAAFSAAGIPVSIRRSRGQDVSGACGTLARKGPTA